jgi:hypothetical protein
MPFYYHFNYGFSRQQSQKEKMAARKREIGEAKRKDFFKYAGRNR